jgi:Tfp pilus assembly protein PilX
MLIRRLFARLRDERGISLIMAMGIMCVLSMTTVGVVRYTSASVTHSGSDNAGTTAYQLAEEGINNAIAILNAQLDPDTGFNSGVSITDDTADPDTSESILFPPNTENKTFWVKPEVRGRIDLAADLVIDVASGAYYWNFTSTGTVTSGATVRKRTLTRSIEVLGLNAGATASSWSRFYQDDATTCLTVNTVNFPTAVATRGNLCLINGGSITGAGTTVNVGGSITISGPNVNSPTNYADIGSGTSWSSPGNIVSNNGVYTTYSVPAHGQSNTLTVRDFDFAIPSNAIIRGIDVEVDRYAGASYSLDDYTVYLTKDGVNTVGSNHAAWGDWGTSPYTRSYGSSSDLWGTTWTAAEINSANFGVRFRVDSDSDYATTAYLDHMRITITYSADTNGIGTPGTPVASVDVGSTCKYNAQAANSPCTATDHVYAAEINTVAAADNPALEMPEVDLDYWFENAKPGPKQYCTNLNPNMGDLVFDNDNSTTWNGSVNYNDSDDDITPSSHDYTCQVVENGVLVGEISWNRTTRVLKVNGTIFFDGDVRFDGDGEVVHYQGRAIIYAADDVEFDEQVCAGGEGTTSCVSGDMSAWSPSQNLLVIMSGGDSEYDVGDGAYCSPANTATCSPQNNPVGAFQGVVAALGTCTIHQSFRLSGPVICNRLTLPAESDGWPQYFAFPSLGELVDGQKYRDTSTAENFELANGAQLG